VVLGVASVILSLLASGISPLGAQPDPDHHFMLTGITIVPSGGIATVGLRHLQLTEDFVSGWVFSVANDHSELVAISVEPSYTTMSFHQGLGPDFMVTYIVPDGICGGVVLDFLGVEKLPPGDHILHWIEYEVVMPPGEFSDLEFNSTFGCGQGPPATNAVVVAGASLPPVMHTATIYSITPPSQYAFDFKVGSDGEVHVPVGATTFSTTVSLQQTGGPTAEVHGFTLSFYDIDPAPGPGEPFEAVAVEPIGVLAALNGGLGPAYIQLSTAYYPDESQEYWSINVNFDLPFADSLQFLAREEILRIDFEVTTPVVAPVTYHVDCGGYSSIVDTRVIIESGPSTTPIIIDCWLPAATADGNFDVIFYQPPVPEFRRGDCNTDGTFDIGDTISGLSFLFSGGLPSSCESTCDTNDDGVLDIGDPISGLAVLFAGGQPLPDPGPWVCGPDPTPSGADCLAYICP